MCVIYSYIVKFSFCICILWERIVKDFAEKFVGILLIRGVRYIELFMWELGNFLIFMEFLVFDSDVAVNYCSIFGFDKMSGLFVFLL